jgi:general secretion pathway protein B
MSYILDALKRANAEREREQERGHVPNLQAQPQVVAGAPALAQNASSKLPWVLVALLALGLVAVGLWAWLQSGGDLNAAQGTSVAAAPPSTSAPPAPASTPTTPTPTPTPTPAAPVQAQAPSPAALPAASTPATPAPATPATPTQDKRASAPDPKPSAAQNATTNAALEASPTLRLSPSLRSTKPTQPVTGAAPKEQLPTLAELAPELRAKLPDLSVSGVSYSESAQLRILIIGGKVYQEQDNISANLKLERIGPKSAVLRVDEQRFRLSY